MNMHSKALTVFCLLWLSEIARSQDFNIKPSQIFCGGERLYLDHPVLPPWQGAPNLSDIVGGTYDNAVCGSIGTPRVVSLQNVEVRGWVLGDLVTGEPGDMCGRYPNNDDPEYLFNVALDIGWTPDPTDGSITPLNSLDAFIQYVRGGNVIEFGARHIKPPTVETWGGPGQVVIHVENDAWAPHRGGSTYWRLLREGAGLPGWEVCGTEVTPDGSAVGMMFFNRNTMPTGRSLSHGDYVRVVGTLFRDALHIDCHGDCATAAKTQAKRNWLGYTHEDYWAEIHAPDSIEKLQNPPPPDRPWLARPTDRTSASVVGYAIAPTFPNSYGLQDLVAIEPPNLFPNTRISSIEPRLWFSHTPHAATEPVIFPPYRVQFTFQSGGAMIAYYKVNWTCTPDCSGGPGTSDRCGAICASPTVASVSPPRGPNTGRTPVTITGTSFMPSATVTFGGTPALGVVEFVDATTLRAISPPHAIGPVEVAVTVNGRSGSRPNAFTYFMPPAQIMGIVNTTLNGSRAR